MFNIIDINYIKKSNRYNQDEIDLCCMIANRFTNQDLMNASYKLRAFMRNDKMFPKKEIKEFINDWANENFI